MIQADRFDEATEAFYRLDPARKAFNSVPNFSNGTINRMMWKAEGWLMGYNGGAIRHPPAASTTATSPRSAVGSSSRASLRPTIPMRTSSSADTRRDGPARADSPNRQPGEAVQALGCRREWPRPRPRSVRCCVV
jgi:hypothetical protein